MEGSQGHFFRWCVSRRQARRFLAAVWVVNGLLLASNLLIVAGWQPPLNTLAVQMKLNSEASFTAWYPSALLFILCLVALLQFASRDSVSRQGDKGGRSGWLVLAFLALTLSLSEVAMLHEVIGNSYTGHVGRTILGLRTQWTILLSPFIVLSVILMVRFVRRELVRVPGVAVLALAGLGCWVATVLLEFAEWTVLLAPNLLWLRAFEPTVEEMCELTGTVLMLTATLRFGFATPDPGAAAACRPSPAPLERDIHPAV